MHQGWVCVCACTRAATHVCEGCCTPGLCVRVCMHVCVCAQGCARAAVHRSCVCVCAHAPGPHKHITCPHTHRTCPHTHGTWPNAHRTWPHVYDSSYVVVFRNISRFRACRASAHAPELPHTCTKVASMRLPRAASMCMRGCYVASQLTCTHTFFMSTSKCQT